MVWNRTPERADQLARDLKVEAVREPREADVLVNATSVGLDPTTSEHDALEQLHLSAVSCQPSAVVDLVYRPDASPTPIEVWASRAGARVVGGLEVLVRQGARSLALWTGLDPPLDVMRKAAPGGNSHPAT
jgi:shikimate dehydrogenase